MEEVISRLLQWGKGEKAPPEMIQIYPTNLCNLKCIFCYQRLDEYDYTNVVSDERWFQITKEICEMDVKRILISGGGEPLCTPELTIRIMEIVKSYGLEGRMINNGTLWTTETIRKTVEIGWDGITFSVDASNAGMHDKLRGVDGSFSQIIKNIKLFNKIKKELGKNKPVLELTSVLCKNNYKEVIGMVELARSLSIKHVNIEPVCVNNEEVKKIKLNENERKEFLLKIIPKAEQLAQKYEICTNFDVLKDVKFIEKTGELKEILLQRRHEDRNEKNKKKWNNVSNPFLDLLCYEPWLWPKIEANGEVCPCSTAILKTNIRDRDFKDIWFGSEFENFRKNIMDEKLSESCSNCVATHLAINRKIRKKLRNIMINSLPINNIKI